MSIQDDIFDVEHYIETGKQTSAQDIKIAQGAWESLYKWIIYIENENERLMKENTSMKNVITIKSN